MFKSQVTVFKRMCNISIDNMQDFFVITICENLFVKIIVKDSWTQDENANDSFSCKSSSLEQYLPFHISLNEHIDL